MEYLSLSEVRSRPAEIREALEQTLAAPSMAARPSALQWQFLRTCLERTLDENVSSGFDGLTAPHAAQLKFEVERKLRRLAQGGGDPLSYVFALMHRRDVERLGLPVAPEYPSLCGYLLLVRERNDEPADSVVLNPQSLRELAERAVVEGARAEFEAYLALPEVRADPLREWFAHDGPAYREILNVLTRHSTRRWVISNPWNPSTHQVKDARVVGRVSAEHHATVRTTEYWYLRWFDERAGSYIYPYRETNRQEYTLVWESEHWKILENRRPGPRSSTPHRR